MLCMLADNRNPHSVEIVSNFEITNKRIFSIAGRMFKPDRCRLPDKRFEALMFVNCNEDFKHILFLFNQYYKVFVAVEQLTEERGSIWLPWPAKCKPPT